MIVAMKLSEVAEANGVSRQSACCWFHAGVTSFCSRLYGRRSAKRRASLAVEAAGEAA
jgi:predicted site-specific integrase-resolvase